MKKVLIWIVMVLVVLLGIPSLIGLMNPTVEYTNTIQVSKGPMKSFGTFVNPLLLGEWMEGFESITPISGIPGMPGSQYELVITQKGERYVMVETITEMKPMTHFAMQLDNEMMLVDVSVDFNKNKDGTEIVVHNTMHPKSFIFQCVLPLFKGTIQEQSQQNYNDLKALIEG